MDGRGLCGVAVCGCTEYRPTDTEVAEVGPKARSAALWRCDDCGQQFDRPQALGSHRRYVHPQTGTAAEPPPVAVPASVAADRGPAPATSTDVEDAVVDAYVHVDPDDVLLGLVRALEKVFVAGATPSEVVEEALTILRYMQDAGWAVIEGGK